MALPERSMEPSPLTQQSRPEIFQPKIVLLYETLLLNPEFTDPSEGFWREFFLLSPERLCLSQILDLMNPDDILQIQSHIRQLVARAIQEATSGRSPTNLHALETLTTFLSRVLIKKYTNPSSDIITVLAGLDEVDHVITELVSVIDGTIRNGPGFEIQQKAIELAISMTSGAYKTSLLSYCMHRDLFPSLMKFIHDSNSPTQVFRPFLLLGLLANYNKFEFQNPYQLRLDDFVNEATIQKIVNGVGATCTALRNDYVAVQDDLPEGWNLSSTLVFLGLGALAPGPKANAKALSAEEAKERFAALPSPEAAILLAVYDFNNANKLFGSTLISSMPNKRSDESPFASFLSLTSYLLQHAYRSTRVARYAEANLFTLRILVEDPVLCKQICSDEKKMAVRLCRQRPPYLPLVNGERILATAIFDIMADTINHNLRRVLDINLYSHAVSILFRVLTFVSSNKTRLSYHWSDLWRTLLTLIKFLTTYATDLSQSPRIQILVTSLVDLIVFCISAGDTFLPDPTSYDDLFYKVVETGPILSRFRDVYKPSSTLSIPPEATAAPTPTAEGRSIDALINVSTHFHSLLFLPEKDKSNSVEGINPTDSPSTTPVPAIKKKTLSPREVHEIIKQGYETLNVQSQGGLNTWEKWREADWKPELKRIVRCAVEDARTIVSRLGHSLVVIDDYQKVASTTQ